jgi:hypothetical protein
LIRHHEEYQVGAASIAAVVGVVVLMGLVAQVMG